MRFFAALGVGLFLSVEPMYAAKFAWLPVPPADLAAKESPTSPAAGWEILFSKHVLNSNVMGVTGWTDNYVRAKIYTLKGLEGANVFKIPYSKNAKAWDISARIVKPDGTATELDKSEFKETVDVKMSGWEQRHVSFAFPNLAVGDVIEYHWLAPISERQSSTLSLFCQYDVPVRDFTFLIEGSASDYNVLLFNCPNAELKKLSHYRFSVVMHQLPPFASEPYMPPEKDFRAWILVLFNNPYMQWFSSDDIWKQIGSYLAEDFRLSTHPSSATRALAKSIVGNATLPEEKLNFLYNYCQSAITNFDWTKTAASLEAKKQRDEAQSRPTANDTRINKAGYSQDIDWLFASLAQAEGFETRTAINADRDEVQNVNNPKSWAMMDRTSVAVKIGADWHMYSPGQYVVPPGMLSRKDEMTTMFICDEKKSWRQPSGVAPADHTLVQRKGRFRLDEEGALDGEVEEQLTGHAAVGLKERWWGEAPEEATKSYSTALTERFPAAEISEMRWTNLANRELPVRLNYKVHIPGYAESAGTKFILAPAFFTTHDTPYFTAPTRQYPILFHYAEKISDDVEIIFPQGYELDAASSPKNVADPLGIIGASYKVLYWPKTRTLSYRRNQTIGGNGAIAFRPESYDVIKQLFDQIKRSDDHSFVLKPKAAAVAALNEGASPSLESVSKK